MHIRRCHAIFKRLKKAIPHPKTELIYHSPFELLVAVILSAQATDISVNQATKKLYSVANTPETIFHLGTKRLEKYIRHIGLYHSKAQYILKTCRLLIDRHNSQVPRTRQELEALPGVGRKTANVILNTVFGQATIAVDTHIFRVANRTGLAPGKSPREVEEGLIKVIPKTLQKDAHHLLLLHGRYTCLARNPHCTTCPIRDLCEYHKG